MSKVDYVNWKDSDFREDRKREKRRKKKKMRKANLKKKRKEKYEWTSLLVKRLFIELENK